MAKIIDDLFEFEITLSKDLEYGDIDYYMTFKWDGKHILNNNVLKRSFGPWSKLSEGVIWQDGEEEGYLIEVIKELLEDDTEKIWGDFFDDVTIHFEPLPYWIDYKKKSGILYLSDEFKEEQKQRKKKKKKMGKLPDDEYDIHLSVDFSQFEKRTGVGQKGLTFNFSATREDLEKFVEQLEIEYQNLK
ncbi:hypothetical protein CSB11_02635 [Candidatus Campbellbacteria bacterium]|nr:MAG: hypothetical protein CSB11_02635 [Candidatus Campbellbacteria bacterium]